MTCRLSAFAMAPAVTGLGSENHEMAYLRSRVLELDSGYLSIVSESPSSGETKEPKRGRSSAEGWEQRERVVDAAWPLLYKLDGLAGRAILPKCLYICLAPDRQRTSGWGI